MHKILFARVSLARATCLLNKIYKKNVYYEISLVSFQLLLHSHSHLEVALWESPVKIRINTLFAPRTI